MAYWLAWEEPRAVGDLVHVEKFFARNLGGLIRARTFAGPAREGKSRTPSMYAVRSRMRWGGGRKIAVDLVGKMRAARDRTAVYPHRLEPSPFDYP